MNLICPNCGSTELVYAGTSTLSGGAYEATDQRYTCKSCGYSGPLVIDTSVDEDQAETKDFPYLWVLLLAVLSLSFVALGGDVWLSFLAFAVPSAFLLVFYFAVAGRGSVEEDLKNLDEDGTPQNR